MKKLSSFFILLFLISLAYAQNSVAPVEENDPAAKAILDQIREKYASYQSLDINFTLTIEFPEEEAEVQKGHIAQMGDKYKLDLESQSIISDGKTMWYHLKNRNEVQINDVEEDDDSDDFLSPKNLLNFYDKGEYFYGLVGEAHEKGVTMQKIEFKPLDRDSEYFKMRLTLNKKTQQVVRIKTFGKDGSRYTLQIDEMTPNKTFDKNYFGFDKSQFPGIHVENLRMD